MRDLAGFVKAHALAIAAAPATGDEDPQARCPAAVLDMFAVGAAVRGRPRAHRVGLAKNAAGFLHVTPAHIAAFKTLPIADNWAAVGFLIGANQVVIDAEVHPRSAASMEPKPPCSPRSGFWRFWRRRGSPTSDYSKASWSFSSASVTTT
jgi:hypothetical protein